MFFNGQIVIISSNAASFNYLDSGAPLFITLGNIRPLGSSTPLVCNVSNIAIVIGSYSGFIDDFRLYNRELAAEELCVLMNL